MKYTKVQFIWGSSVNDKITFDLANTTPSDPYIIKSITGLEPPPISLSIAERVFEGGIYQGRRTDNREIVLILGLQPNYSLGQDVSTLRKALYKMLTPRQGGVLKFKLLDDAETDWVQTTGYIKRMEPNLFSQEPEIQITMSCLSAYFEEDLVVYPNLPALSATNPLPITIDGDVSTGFWVVFVLTAVQSFFKLSTPNGALWIRFNFAFQVGDRVWINTNYGERWASVTRSGSPETNLLPYMTKDSNWIQMDPGLNNMIPSTTAYTVDTLWYTPKHWGF